MASPTHSKHASAADTVGLGLCTPAATSKRPASAATPASQAQQVQRQEEQQQDAKASACIASVIENRAKEARMCAVSSHP